MWWMISRKWYQVAQLIGFLTDSICRVYMSVKKIVTWIAIYLSKIKKEFRNRIFFKKVPGDSPKKVRLNVWQSSLRVQFLCPSVYIYIIPIALGFRALSWTVHCLPCHCTYIYPVTSKNGWFHHLQAFSCFVRCQKCWSHTFILP